MAPFRLHPRVYLYFSFRFIIPASDGMLVEKMAGEKQIEAKLAGTEENKENTTDETLGLESILAISSSSMFRLD